MECFLSCLGSDPNGSVYKAAMLGLVEMSRAQLERWPGILYGGLWRLCAKDSATWSYTSSHWGTTVSFAFWMDPLGSIVKIRGGQAVRGL